jgi:hypothetical protein
MSAGKIFGLAAAAALFVGVLAPKAEASVFDITFTSSQLTISAQATAVLDADGTDYDITGIAGNVRSGANSYLIGGLSGVAGTVGNVQSLGSFTFDNVITNVGGVLQWDYNGLAVTAGPSAYVYNVFTDSFYGINNALLTTDPAVGPNAAFEETLGTGTISAVPEPATWAMMILGFLGLGVVGFRRKAGAALRAA